MPIYSKPYLTLDQQVAKLRSRGMEITDVDRAKACLARIGYYRLSAYWYPFRKSEHSVDAAGIQTTKVLSEFKDGTNFPTILDLYVFDKNLRLLVLDALERVEISLRTDIALVIGKADPWAHRIPQYLHGNFAKRIPQGKASTQHQAWLNRVDRKFLESREDFAKHFKLQYPGDHMPIWIYVELWDFGPLSHFYAGLTVKDADAIAVSYGLPDRMVLQTWLRCLNDVRNICAHHSRLWNKPLINRPTWPAQGVVPGLDHILGVDQIQSQTRLYAALLILRFMVKRINPTSTWCKRLIKQTRKFPKSPDVSLKSAGFPAKWKKQDIWK